MTFQESLKILGIEELEERIFHANSRGELMHLVDYIQVAEHWEGDEWFKDFFPYWFKGIVKQCDADGKPTHAIFQHMPELLDMALKHLQKLLEENNGVH